MDWKRYLILRDILDTLYFKPCDFTLNTLEDFVLTYREQEDKCCTMLHKCYTSVAQMLRERTRVLHKCYMSVISLDSHFKSGVEKLLDIGTIGPWKKLIPRPKEE